MIKQNSYFFQSESLVTLGINSLHVLQTETSISTALYKEYRDIKNRRNITRVLNVPYIGQLLLKAKILKAGLSSEFLSL